MSQTTVIKRQCDQCQALTEDIEGSAPPNWIHVSGEILIQRDTGAASKAGEFDFCARWCLSKFIDEAEPVIAATPSAPLLAPEPPAAPVANDDIPF